MADESTNNTGSEGGQEGAESATDTGHVEDAGTDLGEGGQKALAAERRARAAAERQAKVTQKQLGELQTRLQEFEDRDKTEAQKLTERADAAEKRAAAAQTELLRFRVAADKKLPAELADRLQGSTPEEMAEDADKLLTLLTAEHRRQTPSYDGGVRQTARPTSMNDLIRQQAGQA